MAKAIISAPALQERLLVAAIDFGTTYSGYAYSFRSDFLEDPLKICSNRWQFGSLKAPSCILFNNRQQRDSFGYDAEDKYAELCLQGEHANWYFFKDFKMLLYDTKNLRREALLEDENGNPMSAMKVFSESIRYLKDHMISECNGEHNITDSQKLRHHDNGEKNMPEIQEGDIFWVLTVPAIWDDTAKQFMREAAINAEIDTHRLCLALEPEAASLTCRYLRMNVQRGMEQKKDAMIAFTPGTKYLVLDAGGGTCDITVHEVMEDGNVREVYKANGGPWGGTKINDAFVSLLEDIYGEDTIKMFRENNKDAFFDILRDFEGKKKSIKPESENKVTFTIPTSLNNAYKEVTGKDINIDMLANQDCMKNITFTSNKLRFNAIQIKAFFTQTCDEIAEHVKSIFRLPQLHGVENVLMVGGFSESPMLQDAVKQSLGRQKKVFVPLDAGLAVLKGAVIYGHHPNAIISRVSKNTYGIEIHSNFVQGEHDAHRKIMIDGEEKCKGVFDKHVEIGQEVKEGTVFGEHSYVPLRRNSTSIYLKVFTTKHNNPKYIDGCQYLGGLEVDLDDPEIKYYKDKEVLVKMIYGGTELGLEATIVKTGTKMNARFNFLG